MIRCFSKLQDIFKSSFTFVKFENQLDKGEEQSLPPKQLEQENAKHTEPSSSIESELHSEVS